MIALSYSRLSDYRQCPRKFKLKYIDKAPNFQMDQANKSPHLVRGDNVHKTLEKYLVKKKAGEEGISISSLNEVEQTKPLIDKLYDIYDLYPELQIAINDKFERVDWFSKDAWFRVIYDLIGFGRSVSQLFLGDYKTGKFTDYSGTLEDPGQLHLSALVGMAIWPQFEEVRSMYIYVDHKKTIPVVINKADFEVLKERLITEHAEVNRESEWAPCKNEFCKWCDATKDQCMYARKL